MSWLRLDDNFADHPKVGPLSDFAFRLHVTALCYAARMATDGAITTRSPLLTRGSKVEQRHVWEAVGELLRVGLWEPLDADSYCIHDFLDYNTSRADRDELSRKRAEAGARGGRAGKPKRNLTEFDQKRMQI